MIKSVVHLEQFVAFNKHTYNIAVCECVGDNGTEYVALVNMEKLPEFKAHATAAEAISAAKRYCDLSA